MPTKAASSKTTTFEVPPIDKRRLMITLIGDSPLIVHNFGEKARKILLNSQKKGAKSAKREERDPQAEYEACFHKFPDGRYGFPSSGIKQAAVRAAKGVGIPMTDARVAIHVEDQLSEIIPLDDGPYMREDIVRVANGNPDVRFRPEFQKWACRCSVTYNAGLISDVQIINIFNHAGFGSGIGEWRPPCNGSHGLFHVATKEEIDRFPQLED